MTVCIAAMCRREKDNHPYIVTVSDRQLTMDGIAYEPPQTKVWPLGNLPVVMLLAGDNDAYTEIAEKTERIVLEQQITEVAKIANVCSKQFVELRRRRADIQYLEPIKSLLTRESPLPPELVAQLMQVINSLFNAKLEVEIIVTGLDDNEPWAHILRIDDPGTIHYEDGAGYAAIGEGATLAEFTLAKAQYGANRFAHEALILAYWAKKEATRAATVGPDTWIYTIGPNVIERPEEFALELQKRYERAAKGYNRVFNSAFQKLYVFVKDKIDG